jgi:hypothetical protein
VRCRYRGGASKGEEVVLEWVWGWRVFLRGFVAGGVGGGIIGGQLGVAAWQLEKDTEKWGLTLHDLPRRQLAGFRTARFDSIVRVFAPRVMAT